MTCVMLAGGTAMLADNIDNFQNKPLRVPRLVKERGRQPRQLKLSNDLSRKALSVDEAHAGLTKDDEVIPFTGKGVVIGMTDSGIDPRHPAFADPESNESRVAQYTLTRSAAETSDKEFTYEVYRLADGETVDVGSIDIANNGHGTHTSGTAGGSNRGNPYYGIAPEATLVFTSVGAFIYDDEIAFGISSAMDYAREHNMPCVSSISIGSSFGMHDGSGYMSDILREELDDKGQIVCFSAGNDGTKLNSIYRDFSKNPEPLATALFSDQLDTQCSTISTCVTSRQPGMQIAFSLVCMRGDEPREVWRSDFYNADELPEDGIDIFADLTGFSENIREEGYLKLIPMHGVDNNFGVEISGNLSWKRAKKGTYTIGLILNSTSGGEIYGYTEYDTTSFGAFDIPGYTEGTPDESISDYCTSPYVIAVGAVNDRASYTDIDGVLHEYDDTFGPFKGTGNYTSYGSKPEKLPHTMAPGTDVISSITTDSNYQRVADTKDANGKKWYYAVSSGTSMSTPAIAGVVALWLQADPELTRERIIELLGKVGDPEYGADRGRYGVPSAYAGLKEILKGQSSIYQPGFMDYNPNRPSNLMVKYLAGNRVEAVVPFPVTGGTYTLYSAQGNLLDSGSFTGNSFVLDTDNLSGIAILSVSTPEGQAIQKLRL